MKYPVDIEAGDAFVENLKKKAPAIGGFNGAFKIPDIEDYDEPVLVSGADGVGTKINLCEVAFLSFSKAYFRSNFVLLF